MALPSSSSNETFAAIAAQYILGHDPQKSVLGDRLIVRQAVLFVHVFFSFLPLGYIDEIIRTKPPFTLSAPEAEPLERRDDAEDELAFIALAAVVFSHKTHNSAASITNVVTLLLRPRWNQWVDKAKLAPPLADSSWGAYCRYAKCNVEAYELQHMQLYCRVESSNCFTRIPEHNLRCVALAFRRALSGAPGLQFDQTKEQVMMRAVALLWYMYPFGRLVTWPLVAALCAVVVSADACQCGLPSGGLLNTIKCLTSERKYTRMRAAASNTLESLRSIAMIYEAEHTANLLSVTMKDAKGVSGYISELTSSSPQT